MKVVCQNTICVFYENDQCKRENILLNELGVCESYITTLKLSEDDENPDSFGWEDQSAWEDE